MEYSQEVQRKTKSIKEHKDNVIFRFSNQTYFIVHSYTCMHALKKKKKSFLGHMFKKLANLTQYKYIEHIKFSVYVSPLKKAKTHTWNDKNKHKDKA